MTHLSGTTWPTATISRLFDVRGGTTPSADEGNWNGPVPWVTPVDLRPVHGGYVSGSSRTLSAAGAASVGLVPAPAGSIVLSCRAPVGYVAVSTLPVTTNQGCKSLVATTDVDARYFRYQLEVFRDALEVRGRGSTFVEISSQTVADFPVVAPTLDTQRRIADMLDAETVRIDTLIEKNERVLELLKSRFWSWIELVTHRGLHLESDSVNHSVWGQHRASWTVTTLGRAALSMVDGPFGSSLTSAHYADSGRRVVRLGNIGRGEFKDEAQAFVPETHYRALESHEVHGGDLVMGGLGDESSDAPVGRACVVPSEFGSGIVKADCYRIRLGAHIDHRYAAWALSSQSQLSYAASKARGATRIRLNLQLASALPLPVPPLTEQFDIATEIDAQRRNLAALRAKVDRQQELLRLRRRALITAAVTGQIEV